MKPRRARGARSPPAEQTSGPFSSEKGRGDLLGPRRLRRLTAGRVAPPGGRREAAPQSGLRIRSIARFEALSRLKNEFSYYLQSLKTRLENTEGRKHGLELQKWGSLGVGGALAVCTVSPPHGLV